MAKIKYSSVISCQKEDLFLFLFGQGDWTRGLPNEFKVIDKKEQPKAINDRFRWRLARYEINFWVGFEVTAFDLNEMVEIKQNLGFFESWKMTQRFIEREDNKTQLIDEIEYELPLGVIGLFLSDLIIRKDQIKLLKKRHDEIKKASQIKF